MRTFSLYSHGSTKSLYTIQSADWTLNNVRSFESAIQYAPTGVFTIREGETVLAVFVPSFFKHEPVFGGLTEFEFYGEQPINDPMPEFALAEDGSYIF